MHANLIAGEWVEGAEALENRNPSDLSDVVGEYALADETQVDDAIAAAVEAAPGWAAATPQERSAVLETAGLELGARAEELGEQLSREEGKPRAEGIGEVQRASQILRFFAGEALRIPGEHVRSVRPGVDVDVLREPLGVVGVITPWNFPIAIPAWKIAPALAYGCAVVFKPAAMVPASAWSLVEVLARAGAPAGVLNLVVGPGSVVGERLVHDPRVRGVTFTGSQAVGAGVAAGLAARFGRYQLEMGGKNPLVILDDADLDVAVDCAIQGAFFQTGQRCTAIEPADRDRRDPRPVRRGRRGADARAAGRPRPRRRHADRPGGLGGAARAGPRLPRDRRARRAPSSRSGASASSATPRGTTSSRRCSSATHNDMRINREEIFGPSPRWFVPRIPTRRSRSPTTRSSACRPACARRRSGTPRGSATGSRPAS